MTESSLEWWVGHKVQSWDNPRGGTRFASSINLLTHVCVHLQTSRRVLPVQQLKQSLAHHVYEGAAIDMLDSFPGQVGISWHDLQAQVQVCVRAWLLPNGSH
jgi:hypothetical protein